MSQPKIVLCAFCFFNLSLTLHILLEGREAVSDPLFKKHNFSITGKGLFLEKKSKGNICCQSISK